MGALFLWFLALASLALLSRGVEGVYTERGDMPDFTPYLLLFLSSVVIVVFAWLRSRRGTESLQHPAHPVLFHATVRHASRRRSLSWLLLWWLGVTAALVSFHVGLRERPAMFSLAVLCAHLVLGVGMAVLWTRSARQARFLSDPTMSIDDECQVGGRFRATVAQTLRRAARLERWEISLICEQAHRGPVHQDRRVVTEDRDVHRGEILHGGGIFAVPENARPSTPRQVIWSLESNLALHGNGVFVNRFPVLVHPPGHS